MAKSIKFALMILLLTPYCHLLAQSKYIQSENIRIVKAQATELEIQKFIDNNIDNVKISEAEKEEVKQNMEKSHEGHVGENISISKKQLEEATTDIKRARLRQIFFKKWPEKREVFFSAMRSEESLPICTDGGFENGLAGYTFYNTSPTTNQIVYTCNMPSNINNDPAHPFTLFTPSASVNQFGSSATLVSSGIEPFMQSVGVTMNTTKTGSRALKINPTPPSAFTSTPVGDISSASTNFTVTGNEIDFSYSYFGHIVTTNHEDAFFRYRLIDTNTGSILYNKCIELKQGTCQITTKNDPRSGWSGFIVGYTGWVCEKINTQALIGKAVTLEFTVADCEDKGHFGTVYIDDVCNGQSNCTPTWGSVNFNPAKFICPTTPFTVCGSYTLPAGASISTLYVNAVQGNSYQGLYPVTIDTVNQTFCVTVNPTLYSNQGGDFEFNVELTVAGSCQYMLSDISTDPGPDLTFTNCCPGTLVLESEPNTTKTYLSSTTITTQSAYTVSANKDITLDALYEVLLKPDTTILSGSSFLGRIGGCGVDNSRRTATGNLQRVSQEENSSIEIMETETQLTIVPNPTNAITTISIMESQLSKISLYTIDGREMLKLNPTGTSFDLNLSPYQEGVYLLLIETSEGKIYRRKVLKN